MSFFTRAPLALGPFLLLAVVIAPACERSDLGTDCDILPGDTDAAQSSGTRVETQEIVVHDASLPCDELICVATDGRSGYCSKKCREDAGCPAGFECRAVQPLGDLSDNKYCVWKRCESSSDCGSKGDFCCVPAPNPEAGKQLKLCDFSERYDRCP